MRLILIDIAQHLDLRQLFASSDCVILPIRTSGCEICTELVQPEDWCDLMIGSFVRVYVNDDDPNVYADIYDDFHVSTVFSE